MENDFKCPISHEWMTDPVQIEDRTIYDRSSIMEWFRRGNITSPLTNLAVQSTAFVPCNDLRRKIKEWRIRNDFTYTGCRDIDCHRLGYAPVYLCADHGGKMPPIREFNDEDEVLAILGWPTDSFMSQESVRIYEILLERLRDTRMDARGPLTAIDRINDFSFLDMRKNLRVADAIRLYKASADGDPDQGALEEYLVRRTLCPWLLDKDLFAFGLANTGGNEAPTRITNIARFVNHPSDIQ